MSYHRIVSIRLVAVLLAIGSLAQLATAQDSAKKSSVDDRIQKLEQTLEAVLTELQELKSERNKLAEEAKQQREQTEALEEQQQAMLEEMAAQEEALASAPSSGPAITLTGNNIANPIAPPQRPGLTRNTLPAGLMLGAYGEHHFNFTEGAGGDQSDIHRFVGFMGY